MRRHQARASQMLRAGTSRDNSTVSLISSFDSDLNPSRPAKSSPLGSSVDTGLPLELLDRLRAFPLFQSAPESFLLSIGKSLRPTIYQPSQEIVREGEDAKAMYWLVRGAVRVTSRDGESTYAELRPGAFFGEIGILMDIPRTASIVASIRSLLVRLNKEDLQKELPSFPEVERAIRDEALERLTILERKKQERSAGSHLGDGGISLRPATGARKRLREQHDSDVEMSDSGSPTDSETLSHKKRKSPSPGIAEVAASTALDSVPLTVRQLLKELPLFSGLPPEILHFLGINAQPVSYPPFTEIIKQGSVGRDVYFIVQGDVEVITEALLSIDEVSEPKRADSPRTHQNVRARLKAGQYFGEVTTLHLAPRRTATVRSVGAVECLQISGGVLDDLWQQCGPSVRQQVESEARRRLKTARKDDDTIMTDALGAGVSTAATINGDMNAHDGADSDAWRRELPIVKFEAPSFDGNAPASTPQMEPIDPDPFFNENLDNMRARSRRSSLAPPLPPADSAFTEPQRVPSPPAIRVHSPSPLKPLTTRKLTTESPPASIPPSSPQWRTPAATRRSSLDRQPSNDSKGRLPDSILATIFRHLDLFDLMRCRLVSMHWHQFLTTSPDILHYLDLSMYNRYVTDESLRDSICPFVGDRPREINLSNCFHITDEGFQVLADTCASSVRIWKMKSVWDVSGPAVLALVDKAKELEEIDLSNCRKVGDNLLARVVGWVVPETKPSQTQVAMTQQVNGKRGHGKRHIAANTTLHPNDNQNQPAPGTVIGASKLKRITLSYCKHVQDRSMAHIAAHAADRIETLDLTRCTSISDAGFHSWSMYQFNSLRKLILADCTYLSDQAIVGIVGGCRGLQELDLSFCCALSDTATEVLALGLPALQRLDMAFCGSAVSDNSLRCIGLHLLELRYLGVRGCVRVTGQGVEGVVDGCRHLTMFDVSQCKNLRPWLDRGGIQRINGPGRQRDIRFETVADGSWRSPSH